MLCRAGGREATGQRPRGVVGGVERAAGEGKGTSRAVCSWRGGGGGVSYNNLDQTVNHGMALVMTPGARLLLPLLDSPEEKFA